MNSSTRRPVPGSPAILCFSAHRLSFTSAELVPGTQREHQPGWDEDELDASPPLKEFRGPKVCGRLLSLFSSGRFLSVFPEMMAGAKTQR